MHGYSMGSLVEYLYQNIPLTEILSCLNMGKKHVHVYCFHGKHFMCWDLHGMLETDNFVQKDSEQTLYQYEIHTQPRPTMLVNFQKK